MTPRLFVPSRTGLGLLAALALLAAPVAQAQLRMPGQPGPAATLRPAPAPTPAPTPSSAQRQADYIVAVVNTEPITNNEVRTRLARAEQQLAQQGGTQPSRSELIRLVLERMISEKAQLQLARETGVRVDDEAVDQAELGVARQNQIDRAELRRRLAQDGIALAQFREDLRNQIALTRLRERETQGRANVSDVEVEQFIREQAGNSATSTQEVNLAMVLVALPENSSEAPVATLQARAQRVADRARAGEDFAALAREFSEAADRGRNGGELGLRSADRYPPLFVEATQALRAGDIAGPVRSGAGFHILKVIEKRQGNLPSMTVTQTRARHILLRPGAQLSESAAGTRLADYKRRIQAGQADFAALAREQSQDGSAREGGDLGWVGPGQFVPEFEDVMNSLRPGQLSDPVVSRFGVHLIQVLERRDVRLSESELRELARSQLREKKMEEAFTAWAQDVRARAYVEIREQPQ
jgi:peptidyl-prolyl cis-trans isomerase SurA